MFDILKIKIYIFENKRQVEDPNPKFIIFQIVTYVPIQSIREKIRIRNMNYFNFDS